MRKMPEIVVSCLHGKDVDNLTEWYYNKNARNKRRNQEDEKIYLEKVHQLEERKEFYVRASNILQGSDYQDILVEQYYYNDYR